MAYFWRGFGPRLIVARTFRTRRRSESDHSRITPPWISTSGGTSKVPFLMWPCSVTRAMPSLAAASRVEYVLLISNPIYHDGSEENHGPDFESGPHCKSLHDALHNQPKMLQKHPNIPNRIGERLLETKGVGGAGRNRTADKGFADLCLTTWRPRRLLVAKPNHNIGSAA